MKNIISATILVLAGLVTASPPFHPGPGPHKRPGPYLISEFSAAKGHMTGYCQYDFDVRARRLDGAVHCSANLDAGFSGATWLANVWEGAGHCNNTAVTWTFFHSSGQDATFNVTVNGVKGMYVVPAKDITVNLNNETNPFDNDVWYTGPKSFKISKFEV
ncbi:hypothetical protein QBC34DRAFT_336737 [Podospora aff. communis PSN243]|uniref:Uncharacterized protein n=1 Tax=Podospora aff. communis PSN243 TaxID=3040156 RepID=A0AAV9G420_9PEZI|nr:hypothetical protein QBC34DRAFT_336737 [Podospora aff. communis PSN243]